MKHRYERGRWRESRLEGVIEGGNERDKEKRMKKRLSKFDRERRDERESNTEQVNQGEEVVR